MARLMWIVQGNGIIEKVRSLIRSADAGEVVAALPFGGELAEEALHGVALGGIGCEGEGFAAG